MSKTSKTPGAMPYRGIMPTRMKPLIKLMIIGFSNAYQTRIFPHLSAAVLTPVSSKDIREMNLIQQGDTNVYVKGNE